DGSSYGAAPSSVDLVQCGTCKRTFLPDIWKKHINFCQQSKAKKKYVFDSRSQRTGGTEVCVLKPTQPKAEPPKKPSNWRKNYKDLISSVRAAKILTTICNNEKHREICQKLLAKRRKVFDSHRQRTGGTEIFLLKATQPKPSIWRKKYEDFMASRAHHQEQVLVAICRPSIPTASGFAEHLLQQGFIRSP
uniref:Zinc finger C2HC domain-containing protein 1A n=1 Tax=Gouania willdenowi TaxID=441366 RepID=A0A8C5GIL5_GOUWI